MTIVNLRQYKVGDEFRLAVQRLQLQEPGLLVGRQETWMVVDVSPDRTTIRSAAGVIVTCPHHELRTE